MIEPSYLTVPQLATRWKQEHWQIIDHGLALKLPILFRFHGFALDMNDPLHCRTKAAEERREFIEKQLWILDSEALIHANISGQPSEYEVLDSHVISSLRGKIDEAKNCVDALKERLDKRAQQRRNSWVSGLMRALPQTLQRVQQNGDIAYPRKARHPNSFPMLAEVEGEQHLDDRIMDLEQDESGVRKKRLTLDDLLIPIEVIKAIEGQELERADKPKRPLGRREMQKWAILQALRHEGYDPLSLPKFTSTGGPKSRVKLNLLTGRKELFTTSSFDKAWEELSRANEIAYTESYLPSPLK